MSAPAVDLTAGPDGVLRPVRRVPVSRFAGLVPEIVVAVLARVEADLPELALAPWRDHAADIAWLSFELGRRIDLAASGVPLSDPDLARFAAFYRGAARRGAPLSALQQFTRATVANSFTELWARAEPEDVTDLLRLSRWIARHNVAVERLLVQVYCELLDPQREGADRREALVRRLLAGLDSGDGTGPGTDTTGYLVVVVDRDAAPGADLPSGVLAATVDAHRHLILPIGATPSRRDAWAAMARWVTREGAVRAAGSFTDAVAGIPEAVGTARQLLRTAAAVGLPPGLLGPRDVVLESVLVAQPDAAEKLLALLAPLAADERLLDTLIAFFGNDLDRTRTAAALFLSRGGLSLRLDRIGALTGLDPRSTRGIQVLGAALAVRALRQQDHDPAAV